MDVQLRQRLSDLVKRYKTDNDIYHDLMQFRVRESLLVATTYDAFSLEEAQKARRSIRHYESQHDAISTIPEPQANGEHNGPIQPG